MRAVRPRGLETSGSEVLTRQPRRPIAIFHRDEAKVAAEEGNDYTI